MSDNGNGISKVANGTLTKILIALIGCAGGWMLSQTRDAATTSTEINTANQAIVSNASRIETKVSKEEFAQYTTQMMANQQRIENELAAIRAAQITAAEEARIYRQRGH